MIEEEEIKRYIHVHWYKIGKKLKIVMRLRITFNLDSGEERTVIFRHDFSKKLSEIGDVEAFVKKHVELITKEFVNEAMNLLNRDLIDIGVVEFKLEGERVVKRYVKEKPRRVISFKLEK